MKKIVPFLLLLSLLLSTINTFSQKEANFWYFGRNAGLDFNTYPPTALTNGQLNTTEGCSTFSKSNGKLLFYSDGIEVYNKDHQLMRYSDGTLANNLKGNPSSTQSGMIIPKPGTVDIYYLFTVGTDFVGSVGGQNPGYNYYTIDFTNNPLGEITDGPINLAIDPNSGMDLSASWSEKVTAVKGEDCNVFWVLSFVKDTFYAYKVDEDGVDFNNLKISKVNFTASDKRGYLQVSPNGEKIAFADFNQTGSNINGSLVLFDFDNKTGEVNPTSSQVLIPRNNGQSPYGVAFSQQSNKLYTSSYDGNYNVFQFDLEKSNITSTKSKIISKTGYRGALQLGPDGRIYTSIPDALFLDVIENPNEDSENIIYAQNAINLGGKRATQGLPPFISSLLLSIEIKDLGTGQVINNEDLQFCVGQTKTIKPADVTGSNKTYKWFFNDGTTPIETSSTLTLTNLTNVNNGKYTLNVKLTDDCGNVTQYDGTFNIEVFDAPKARKPKDINFCDTNLTTPNNFNLANYNTDTNNSTYILDGLDSANFEVLYFDTFAKANANINGTNLPNPYSVNTISTQTIYARVHNKNAPNACSKITEFELEITREPVASKPKPYRICDNTSIGTDTDGYVNDFILETRDAEILKGLEPNQYQYSVSYHTSLVGAQTSKTTDAINKTTNYTNINSTTDSQTVYIRVENINNGACFDASKTLDLIVDPLPVLKPNPEIDHCVSANNPNPTVNLTTAENNISTTSNIRFEYYEDAAGVSKITNETSYPVQINATQSVYVKVISDENCSRGLIELKINVGQEDPNGYNDLQPPVCDDFLDEEGNNTLANNDDTDSITNFYLDKTAIINGINPPPNTEVFFYEFINDRANSLNEIDITNFRNKKLDTRTDVTTIANGVQFPIYYKIISTVNNNCQGLGKFFVQINSVPLANPNNVNLDIEECDDALSSNTSDGENSGIDLTENIPDILGVSQLIGDYDVTFHTTKNDAEDVTSNGIPNPDNYRNTAPAAFVAGTISQQTIYVRVQDANGTPKCINTHLSFQIIIHPIPEIVATIADFPVCDTDLDPRNRVTQNINLTLKDTEILAGKTNHRVLYYTTQQDAVSGSNPVTNPSNFENDPNNVNYTPPTNFNSDDPSIQTIFFKIVDETGIMCESVFSTFQLLVYPEPNIPANISDYTECDNDTDTDQDDNNGKIGNITLKNKIPEILANYQPSEYSDFEVTFYTSKSDADSGDKSLAIDENKFENTINNQPIFVRVENTKNTPVSCVQSRLSFNINILTLPQFSVTGEAPDEPQILCLNYITPHILEAENPNSATGYTYLWTDKDNNKLGRDSVLPISKGGEYTVTATDIVTNCAKSRKIYVKESEKATLLDEHITIIDESNNIDSKDNISIAINNNDAVLGKGDYKFAIINEDTETRIPFSGFQDDPLFENLEGGIYTIIVHDNNGCEQDETRQISVIQFPKFFTPNGDGKNDTWLIKGNNKDFYPNASINIFNRFGKLVAQIPIDNQGWDGTYNGKLLPSDDYWYSVQLIPPTGSNKPQVNKKGHFSISRK